MFTELQARNNASQECHLNGLKSPPTFPTSSKHKQCPRKTKNIVVKLHKQVFSVTLQYIGIVWHIPHRFFTQ